MKSRVKLLDMSVKRKKNENKQISTMSKEQVVQSEKEIKVN